jgi:cell division inhibitor SepF
MAGAMRKVGVYLGLLEDSDAYEDEYYADEDGRPAAQQQRGAHPTREERTAHVPSLAERRGHAPAPTTATPTPMPQPSRIAELSRITTLHPRNYNEARTIGEHFRDGIPVIMNLSEMDDSDAKRLVDFSAGLVFGVRGTIERVTNKVFLLSPPNVTVAAEDKRLIAEGGFFNQS